jgi:hypothetical protein
MIRQLVLPIPSQEKPDQEQNQETYEKPENGRSPAAI